MVNEFVVFIDRDVQIPLNVTTLDKMTCIILWLGGRRVEISWVDNQLAVTNVSESANHTWYPVDKDGYSLVRLLSDDSPTSYELRKIGKEIQVMTTKKKKKKKGSC
jgi:hypothetical protein